MVRIFCINFEYLIFFSLIICLIPDNNCKSRNNKSSSPIIRQQQSMSDSQYYIVNIDGEGSLDLSIYNTSIYTQKLNPLNYIFSNANANEVDLSLGATSVNSTFGIALLLLESSAGIYINNIQITEDQVLLSPGIDFTINATIDSSVIPADYFFYDSFSNDNSMDFNTTIKFSCQYNNPGPSYTKTVLRNLTLSNIVISPNYNFGLIAGKTGIQILAMQNFNLNYTTLDAIMTPNLSNNINPANATNATNVTNKTNINSKTDNLNFTSLFFVNQNYLNNYNLIGFTNDSVMHIFNITDDGVNFSASIYGICSPKNISVSNITNIGIYKDSFVISSLKNGLTFIKLNGTVGKTISNFTLPTGVVIPVNANDMIINNQTIYVIAKNYGMLIFQPDNFTFSNYYFNHTRLAKFDYLASIYSYFVGISVDNDPTNNVPEFFIELIVNIYNELNPLVNKIYISQKNLIVDDYATDTTSGLTYIFDRVNLNLIVLTRGIPNIVDNFNYKIDLSSPAFYNFHTGDGMGKICLLADNGPSNSAVIIHNMNDYVGVGIFNPATTTLLCNFTDAGQYQFGFYTQGDCSANDASMIYTACMYNVTYTLDVGGSKLNLTGLWIVLALLLVIIIVIVVFVLCCRRACCKKGPSKASIENSDGVYTKQQSKHYNADNDMMEVHVSNHKL